MADYIGQEMGLSLFIEMKIFSLTHFDTNFTLSHF